MIISRLVLIILSLLSINITFAQTLTPKEKRGKYGFFQNKKKVIDYQYDDITYKYDNMYGVKKDNKWGVVTTEGIQTIECKYDDLSFNWGGGLTVSKEGKFGVVNANDSLIADFKYDGIDYYYQDSIALVKYEGKWGILKADTIDYTSDKIVFKSPDIMPLYESCEEVKDHKEEKSCADRKLMMYIYKSIRYPQAAINNGIQGTVVINFIVTKEGKITEAKCIREIGGGCGEEALRLIKAMKDWIPGQQDGENVATSFNLPVKFRLE